MGPRALDLLPLLFLTLLLLVTLIVITPLGRNQHRWVPPAAHGTPVSHRQPVMAVDRHGQFWIPNAPEPGPVRRADLGARLDEAISARGGARRLSLQASPGTRYSYILDAIEVARELRVETLDLLVDCPAGSESLRPHCRP